MDGEEASLKNSVIPSVDIEWLYSKLCLLAEVGGVGSYDKKEAELLELLESLDPLSVKFVIRIILGRLRLGFLAMTLLDSFSWMFAGDKSLRVDLEEAYNRSADIGTIIFLLKQEGLEAIKKIEVTVGVPVIPAAAERLSSSAAIIEKIGPCIAQPKLDGFRLQVHVNALTKSVSFFSRNLKEMSGMFPELSALLVESNSSFIAEGEAIAFDSQTNSFLPFQQTVKRKRKHDIELAAQETPLRFYFFDLLFLEKDSLMHTSHTSRRRFLEKLMKGLRSSDQLQLIEEHSFDQAKPLQHYFESVISVGLEGLVVKKPDTFYKPGKRNFNWIKLKREETGSLDDTVDCVVLGYYAGRGKRARFGIGALLVGVYHQELDCFQTVAKIGTGFTDDEWIEVKRRCDLLKVQEAPPLQVECHKTLFPDVWVQPEIIIIVRADEVSRSPLHTAGINSHREEKSAADKEDNQLGYALRFPRFIQYCQDKLPQQTTSADEIRSLYKQQFLK